MPRLSAPEMQSWLASKELLRDLEEPALREIAETLEWVRLPGGQTLFEQGEIGDGLYMVMSGRLRVIAALDRPSAQQNEAILREVGRGEMVGELAILTKEPRSATVRAIRDTELVKFSHEAFYRIAEKFPQLLKHVALIMAKRLREGTRLPRKGSPASNITLLPITPGALTGHFVNRLSQTLGDFGPVLHLTSARFEDIWGERGISQTPIDSPASATIGKWLNDQEGKFRFILYEVDPEPSHWSRRCLRQADKVLRVGCAEASPDLSRVELDLLGSGSSATSAAVELALVTSRDCKVKIRTHEWLALRRVQRHYHVREGVAEDYARLARLASGCANGLVLSGGGMRALAHIGVLRAIEEHGVPIDVIGGTSMGAVIAGQYALGEATQSLVRLNKAYWKDHWPMNDYTVPMMACLAGKKLDDTFRHMFGEARIEDLTRKYFCTSTDLTSGTLVVHQRGPMWKFVRASCSLPGILPPVFEEGHLLVDGALLNNVPAEVMKNLCGGPVLAVNVSPTEDDVFTVALGDQPDSHRLVWNRLNPFAEKIPVPSLFDILVRSATISSIEKERQVATSVDFYLHPPLEQFGIGDAKSLEAIVDAGYEYAQKKLGEWKTRRSGDGELSRGQASGSP